MSAGWKKKRFWDRADSAPVQGGYGIFLDGRPLRTPAKRPLVVPGRAMALAIAEEWQQQEDEINPETMPVTRSANAAIDKVAPQFSGVVDQIASYADTDLLCYRAQAPKELRDRQDAAWDPLLDWAERMFGARLAVGTGVIYVPQDERTLAALKHPVLKMDSFRIAALHDLVGLSGSFVIGMAAAYGFLPVRELWVRSRIDENWQEEQWGVDDIARGESARKRDEFLHANRFFRLAEQG